MTPGYRSLYEFIPDPYKVAGSSSRIAEPAPVDDVEQLERRADRLAVTASTTRLDDAAAIDFRLERTALSNPTPKRRPGVADLTRNAGTYHSVAVLERGPEDGDGWRVTEFCIRLPRAPVDEPTREECGPAFVASLDAVRDARPPTEVAHCFSHFWTPTSVPGAPTSGGDPPTVPSSQRLGGVIPTRAATPHVFTPAADVHPSVFLDFVAELVDAYTERFPELEAASRC